MAISLRVPGASPENLALGLAAAMEVFEAAGVSPQAAARAAAFPAWLRGPKPAGSGVDAARAFDIAERYAIITCCQGADAPAGSRLAPR